MKIKIRDEFMTCVNCEKTRRHEIRRTQTVIDENFDKVEFEYWCKACGHEHSAEYNLEEIPF